MGARWKIARLALVTSVFIPVPACASSYDRWQALLTDPALSSWARCMDDLSSRWWAEVHAGSGVPVEGIGVAITPQQAFAAILGHCGARNATNGQPALDPRRRRVIEDARQNFLDIDRQHQAAQEASISGS